MKVWLLSTETGMKKSQKNILELIEKNKGRKILFIVGADHRSRAVAAIKKAMEHGASIQLIN